MELVLFFPELDGPDDHPEDEEHVNADDEEYEGDSQGSGSLPDDDHHDDRFPLHPCAAGAGRWPGAARRSLRCQRHRHR